MGSKATIILTAALLATSVVPAAAKPHAHVARKAKKKARVPIISISPAMPIMDQSVTVHLHPRAPLPQGDVYTITIATTDGQDGDGYSHLAFVDTKSTSATISPTDDPIGGNEWEQGAAFVAVSEGPPSSSNGTKEVGANFQFRFLGLP